jgi:hypothetical protein
MSLVGLRRLLATNPLATVPAPDERIAPRGFFTARRRAVWARAATHAALGISPVLATILVFRGYLLDHHLALDFENGPWLAGRALLHGLSPYVAPNAPALASGEPFVYPAAAAILLTPFALLPQALAGVIFAVLCIGGVLLSLFVLQVRDWRVYGAVLMSPALIHGWTFANLSVLLVLGVALCWRYRDRPPVVGAAVALLISVKVYFWPLGLWLLATRRYVASAHMLVWGLAINLVAWSIIGFDQLSRYSALMRALTRLQEWYGYSLVALALNNGASSIAAYALALPIAAAVAVACFVLGRRGHDRAAFALGIAVSLLATPILWLHYFIVLLVPLAVVRPRFGLVWLIPCLMWTPATHAGRWPGSWPVLVALGVGTILTLIAVRGTVQVRSGDELPARRGLRLAGLLSRQ